MQVDQARHQRRAGQGDALRIRGRVDGVRVADGDDRAVAHEHGPAGMRGAFAGPDPLRP